MANLGTISATLVERLCVEFAEQLSSTGTLVGTYDSTERLLLKVMDREKVDAIMEEIRGPRGSDHVGEAWPTSTRRCWPTTSRTNTRRRSPSSSPRSARTMAPRVLALLPESFAMEVVMRMLRMEAVQKDVLDDVERTLRTEFMTNLARTTNRRDSHEMDGGDLQTISTARPRTSSLPRWRNATATAPSGSRPLMFHLRGPGETGPDRGADPAACGRQGQAGDRPQGRVREPARAVSSPTCRSAPAS